MKKTFEQFLEMKCAERNPGVLDDQMCDFFDKWVCELEVEDWLMFGEMYACEKQIGLLNEASERIKICSQKF